MKNKLSLYIHWPFCIKKCHYCDLNSHVDPHHNGIDYVDAIITELIYYYNKFPNYIVNTIFFGGGTPSLMKSEWIKKIIDKISELWESELYEITLEANPSNQECDLLGLKNAGINRISFGVQSFDDQTLLTLGRTHTANEAITMIKKAQLIFDKVSIDLMYGLPNETLEIIGLTLDKIIELEIKHLSIYSLTIEKNTVFGQMALELPDEDQFCKTYELILEKTKLAKLQQYEISSFAMPGYESQHNINYWEYGNWLGIGPGAHSRMKQSMYIENEKLPKKWLQKTQDFHYGSKAFGELSELDIAKERLLMGLRQSCGMKVDLIKTLFGNEIIDKLNNLEIIGDVSITENNVFITQYGFLRYNAIIRYLWD